MWTSVAQNAGFVPDADMLHDGGPWLTSDDPGRPASTYPRVGCGGCPEPMEIRL
jgi:hypothetical protein